MVKNQRDIETDKIDRKVETWWNRELLKMIAIASSTALTIGMFLVLYISSYNEKIEKRFAEQQEKAELILIKVVSIESKMPLIVDQVKENTNHIHDLELARGK